MKTFSVVTTCKNPGHLLVDTVESVLGQRALRAGRVGLEYVIIDGGSTDGTCDYLAELNDERVHWVSEPDRGMYDGLVKGLRRLTGDIHSYLNAGDLYHASAFDVVADLVPSRFEWVTGLPSSLNQRGDVVGVRIPFRYRRDWIMSGLYDGGRLPFIQQESTFWTSDLTASLDLDRLSGLRLAGDAFLWATFARQHELGVVVAQIGGFRRHDGQLSEDLSGYREEMARVCTHRHPTRCLPQELSASFGAPRCR